MVFLSKSKRVEEALSNSEVRRLGKGFRFEQDVRNEAIMAIIFMGDKRQPSGSVFIPDIPYFIGLFLCSGAWY